MKIAVIIPCLNEEATIGKVVQDSFQFVPKARVFVLDNGSTDSTAVEARAQGATVIHSPLRGKGHALRHAFRVIDADYFVMVDGDGTYPLSHAMRLIQFAIDHNYEMVMGARLEHGKPEAFRPLHYLGNRAFTGLVRTLFQFPVHDLLTGFRVFSRRYVQQTQLLSRGFEVETELTVRAVAQDLAFAEIEIPYQERPPNSRSKLRTFRDGWIILCTVLRLWRNFRPFACFNTLAVVSMALSFAWPGGAWPGQVLAALLFAAGLVLDSRLDLERMNRNPRVAEAEPTVKIKVA